MFPGYLQLTLISPVLKNDWQLHGDCFYQNNLQLSMHIQSRILFPLTVIGTGCLGGEVYSW